MRSAKEVSDSLSRMAQGVREINVREKVLIELKQHADAEPQKSSVALVEPKLLHVGKT
jgi:hypothetical protein